MAAANVLALPLAHVVFEVSNNEVWVDSLRYVVEPNGSPPPETETPPRVIERPQLDLRGIAFEMQLRRRPQDNEVVLQGGTTDGMLSVGAAPNWGHLIFYVPEVMMRRIWPGQYVGDVRASNARFERVCLTLDVTVLEGITR
jgi:hypothetical protein